MVVNKSCVAACLESVRMAVESVSGCAWNECPDQRGITVRMCVEWVSESAWNPHIRCARLCFSPPTPLGCGLPVNAMAQDLGNIFWLNFFCLSAG